MSSNNLIEEFQSVESRLEGQLQRKEYELALQSTERLIEICSNLEGFDIEKWIDYYSKIKDHMFRSTYEEKKEIISRLIKKQEYVRLNRFQSLMKLNFIEDFEFVIQSLPESDLYRFRETRIEFFKPQNRTVEEAADDFIQNLYMVIQ